MFFRTKKSGSRSYLQIVENRWENGRSRQRVVATLGRLDQLRKAANSMSTSLRGSTGSFRPLLSAHAKGRLPVVSTSHIGPALIFGRLWQQTGCQRVIKRLLGRRVSSLTSSEPFSSRCSIVSSSPAVIEPPKNGSSIIRSRAVVASTAPSLPGHGLAG